MYRYVLRLFTLVFKEPFVQSELHGLALAPGPVGRNYEQD